MKTRTMIILERIAVPAVLLLAMMFVCWTGGRECALEANGKSIEYIRFNEALEQQALTNVQVRDASGQMREALSQLAEALSLIHESNMRARDEAKMTQRLVEELLIELRKERK